MTDVYSAIVVNDDDFIKLKSVDERREHAMLVCESLELSPWDAPPEGTLCECSDPKNTYIEQPILEELDDEDLAAEFSAEFDRANNSHNTNYNNKYEDMETTNPDEILHFHIECLGVVCGNCNSSTLELDLFAYDSESAQRTFYNYARLLGWRKSTTEDEMFCQLCINNIS